MGIHRTNEFGYVKENDLLAESYERRISAYNNPQERYINGKLGVQRIVNEYIEQTGLAEYIKKVNSEIESGCVKQAQVNPEFDGITSLLDIPYIKEAVDKAIDRKQYAEYISLLNDLANIVKYDDDIPPALKNVLGDKKLNDYVKEKMPVQKKLEYDLSPVKTDLDGMSQHDNSAGSYFGFGEEHKQ
jgi:hypothetical protein